MYEHLKIEEKGNIAIMTISAPKSLNALNSTILGEIDEYLDEFEGGNYRCLIITGDGEKSFVAGADISEMAPLGPQQGETFGRKGAEVFRRIETLPCPVIAAVNGFALGGGCELAMACDIRLCSDNAKFGQPEVGLAKQLIYTGKAIKANEALRIGLVNEVVPSSRPDGSNEGNSDLMNRAIELAEQIAANAPLAVRAAKLCINTEWDMEAEDAIAFENRAFGLCFNTEDQKNGMQAFLTKGKCEFQGK